MAGASCDSHEEVFDSDFEEGVTHDAEDLLGQDGPSGEESMESSASPTGVIRVYLTSLKEKLTQEMAGKSMPSVFMAAPSAG